MQDHQFKPCPGENCVVLAGDASGGHYAGNPFLRRVGCGLAQFDKACEVQQAALAWGLASPEPQNTGYAELDALLVALELVEGSLIYVGDNDAVVDGWHDLVASKPPRGVPH